MGSTSFPGSSVNLVICVGSKSKLKVRWLGRVHVILFFFFPTAKRCEPLVSLVLRISSSSVLSRPGGVIRLPPSRASSANHTSHGSTNRKINCRPTERLTGGRFLWYNEAGDTGIRLLNTDGISGQLILTVMQGQRSSVSLSAEPDHNRVCSIHTDTVESSCTDC